MTVFLDRYHINMPELCRGTRSIRGELAWARRRRGRVQSPRRHESTATRQDVSGVARASGREGAWPGPAAERGRGQGTEYTTFPFPLITKKSRATDHDEIKSQDVLVKKTCRIQLASSGAMW